MLNPTVPLYNGYSPAWGQFEAEQVWGVAQADVVKDNMKVADAVDKALRRCNEIFARITI